MTMARAMATRCCCPSLSERMKPGSLPGLYSLMATCEANGVNPDYLADVLLPVQTHPASRIDELLQHNWRRLRVDSS